ncbi:MAG: hypothetical protein HCA25_23600 [Dolichospermum sp. DET50]|nr:hypothetical protein [Dolichospermum sp. DET66]MBS3035152.1 hypothetical protein [Dolichospermum sp. DET67]MBS3040352.1 hypothetical protein [Dolichospermum sp. DET50]QSX67506.1 MAG: hypothetical protein EZY12_22875 [Dolichospermum sp. DET69]
MEAGKISVTQARLKMTLWNADAEATASSDFYLLLQEMGLPEEVVTRLHQLISNTIKVGEKVVSIGKVVLKKIFEFVKAHPFLVTSVGISAVVASAIYSLIVSIPFLGQFLEPVARALGIGIVVTGAVIGHTLDKKYADVGQNIVEVANEFFKLLIDVFSAVSYQVAFS